MCAKREHPDYGYEIIKPKKEKNSYKGLNRPLVYDYLDCFGTDEMMEAFNQMKKDGTGFPTIKSWFLELYPNIEVTKTQRAMAQKDLADRKATVRKVVKAKMVKAEEAKASTIALASNF